MKPSVVALVPARAGSKRVPGKNVRRLDGHPLIAYSIAAALDSGVFDAVVVSTDSQDYADIARDYGAETPVLRPPELARSRSPDVEWVDHILKALADEGRAYDCFSILRPTSPFRQAETIRRAWHQFRDEEGADSLRAVEKCSQHPGKMWTRHGQRMLPLMPFAIGDQPWHSNQYAALPEVWVQNASLEIAYCRVVSEQGTIAGTAVVPFLTEGYEGFDINDSLDWKLAELLIREGGATLPDVARHA